MDVNQTIKQLTNDYNSILPIEKAMELGLHPGPGNGSGDRTKMSQDFIHVVLYGNNREPMIYPKSYDEIIDRDEDQKRMIEEYKQKRIDNSLRMGKGVIGFIILGDNDKESTKRPIREDIKKHYRCLPCLTCGTRKTICDHKNDLYNDPRVLDKKTQTLDDFQPLCNNCNLRKRAVSMKTVKEKKRQPPPLDRLAMNGGIEFTRGDETFDPNDPNAMVGTFWYDPIAFGKESLKMNSHKSYNYYNSN
tara:strand:- start:400 stop:1140 length:741 start_codon:yes stop_codon:yes gene_type:complete